MHKDTLSTAPSFAVRTGRRCAAVSSRTRWSSVATALLLAACVHSPQAAVPASPEPRAASAAAGQGSAQPCAETSASRIALQGITQQLKAQGLAFRASCQVAQSRSGWVVQVKVTDGVKASKVVRGPLADGHDVDMGTPPGVELAGAQTGAQGFSPDVQHNRDWLRGLMARHQFDNLPTAWWHFAQRGAAPASSADTDLASR